MTEAIALAVLFAAVFFVCARLVLRTVGEEREAKRRANVRAVLLAELKARPGQQRHELVGRTFRVVDAPYEVVAEELLALRRAKRIRAGLGLGLYLALPERPKFCADLAEPPESR